MFVKVTCFVTEMPKAGLLRTRTILVVIKAGERAQQLGVLAALPEDPGSICRTHMAAHTFL